MDPQTLKIIIAIIVALGAISLSYIFSMFFSSIRMNRKMHNIPQPFGSVLYFGHAFQLIGGKPWEKMRSWCADMGLDGKIIHYKMFNYHIIYLNQPQLLKRVLLTNQRNYCKDIDFSYKHFMCLLGSGLVTAEGELWRRGRLLLTHALRIDILEEVPRLAVSSVNRLLAKMRSGAVVDLNEEYRHLTLQVISQAAVSFTPEHGDEVFAKLYLPIVHECNARVWAPYRKYMPWLKGYQERSACLKALNAVLDETIRSRWEQRKTETANNVQRSQDILDKCMEKIPHITNSMVLQLRDDIKTMLLAGHETSAALLTWATYEVMRHPEVEKELIAEAEIIFGDYIRRNEYPSLEEVKKLRWAPAVLSETLRLHSVVPCTMRRVVQDDFVPRKDSGLSQDIIIPRGAIVGVGIDGVHMRADIYPEPEKFKPERFFEEFDERDPYSYIPFISGPRGCLGKHLALTETQIVLSYMIYNMKLAQPKNYSKNLDEIGEAHDYTVPMVPKYGLEVVATSRY